MSQYQQFIFTFDSSLNPKSLPIAAAKRFPCTKLPTTTDAGPICEASAEEVVEVPESCNKDPSWFFAFYMFKYFFDEVDRWFSG